jgi:hypothetical protein
MPAQLQFLDMEAVTGFTQPGYFVAFPVTLGPSWQPGDIRVLFQDWGQNDGTNQNAQWLNVGVTPSQYPKPPGFTNAIIVQGQDPYYGFGMDWRRLQPGDTDTFIVFPRPDQMARANFAFVTVRGVDPTFTPAPTAQQGLGPNVDALAHPAGLVSVSSLSIPTAGTAVFFIGTAYDRSTLASTTGASLGCPTGWTNLTASEGSGATYTPYSNANASAVFAKSFSSSGSTGTVSVPFGNAIRPYFDVLRVFFRPAPDVSATAGSASAVPTSANATGGTTNVVVASAGGATSASSSSTAFNPVEGYWISDPLTLPGDPVTSSVIRWGSSVPLGSTLSVETSINNGASWDTAVNNRAVARLAPGDTGTRSVLVRIKMSRNLATDPAPTVSYLEMQVSTDSGTDELVPIGHGMIDKVTVKTVGGSSGGGSSTSGASSSAVTSRGGGQTGGGTSIKVHVTDLSRAIKRNVWQMPFVVPKGTNYGDAVKLMVLNRLPSQTEFAISTTTRTLDTALVYGLDQGGDPWQDIREVAMAVGFECYFDPRGVFVFRPVPDPRIGEPVFTFDEDFNPIVAEAQKELSDEQTFNDVVVTGQSSSTSNPVSAEAFDNDPASRTYILGDYGRVTQRLTFTNITTTSQAQDAANAVLFNSLGAAETVTIICVPHPALEPGDVVKLKISNVKVDGTYAVNSMVTPMSPGEPQQLVCFRQSTNA